VGELNHWEILLLLIAGYVAVMSLVKLMNARRDMLVKQVEQQVAAERERRKKLEKKRRHQERDNAA
jgi:hypothetical protein